MRHLIERATLKLAVVLVVGRSHDSGGHSRLRVLTWWAQHRKAPGLQSCGPCDTVTHCPPNSSVQSSTMNDGRDWSAVLRTEKCNPTHPLLDVIRTLAAPLYQPVAAVAVAACLRRRSQTPLHAALSPGCFV